jgi:peptide/nickel transport system substrate-binding protein
VTETVRRSESEGIVTLRREKMKDHDLLKGVLAILLLIFFGLETSPAQTPPKRGGTLTVGTNTDVNAVDPHTNTAVPNAVVLHHVFESLVSYGDKFEFMPTLAERWKIEPDYRSYTFYLRKGKLFHNGREMEASDVKYSIERVLDPKTGSGFQSHFETIDRIEIVDKHTVRFQMKKPDAGLLYKLAYNNPIIAIVPREEIEKQGGVFKHPVGTGPYKFVEWKPDRYLMLERFDQYKPQAGPMNGMGGERVAYLDRLKFVPIPEGEVATMALLNREIDFLLHVPFENVERFHKDYTKKGIVLDEIPGDAWYQIWFGCKQPVTRDVKFRQACAYAIDQEMVAKAATRGYSIVNPSLVGAKNVYFTSAHTKWYKKDVRKAKELLKESGYKGEPVTLFTSKKYKMMYDQAVAVQAELAAVGINIKIEVVDLPVLVKKYVTGDYQILSFGVAAKPDPVAAYIILKQNQFDEQYPRMKDLMTQASATLDFETRKKLFEEAHQLVYDGVPCVNFYHYFYFNAYWNNVKGFKMLPTNMPRFWNVWLSS